MNKKIYITTPIYYVNDVPHIGHAYTTIAADVLARYHKQHGRDVFFLTGTDEHGQKIEQSAEKAGLSPKEFTDKIVNDFKELWKTLNISYDGFIRTTDDIHIKTVQKIFTKLYEKGDIYKGEYEGWYCVPCESYFLEIDLDEEKNCPDCGRPLSQVKEESYFFKLSQYENQLLDYYKKNPKFLKPKFRGNEMINFIKSGLKDLCVTRTKVPWAVPVPFDEKQYVYVWFDALINYVSAIGYLGYLEKGDNSFMEFWPCDIHLVGKEIYKFHTIIWPAMLFALGVEPPKQVYGHGWWTVEGEKMSKTTGNVVDPHTIVEEYNEDVLRYFVLREVPFGSDGDFSHSGLEQRYNSALANDLGNLFSRVLKMVNKYNDGVVPDAAESANVLWDKAKEIEAVYEAEMHSVDFYKALIKVWELISEANKYVEDKAPWKLAKQESDKKELESVLCNLCSVLFLITRFVNPFMPTITKKMIAQLGLKEEDLQMAVKAGEESVKDWKTIMKNIKLGEVEVLFPRK